MYVCMYERVCMYVCMFVCMSVFVCMYACMFVCMCERTIARRGCLSFCALFRVWHSPRPLRVGQSACPTSPGALVAGRPCAGGEPGYVYVCMYVCMYTLLNVGPLGYWFD